MKALSLLHLKPAGTGWDGTQQQEACCTLLECQLESWTFYFQQTLSDAGIFFMPVHSKRYTVCDHTQAALSFGTQA